MNEDDYEYIIIGAGPAGVQLAYFLEQQRRRYVVLEAARLGEFFRVYPRHRKLISTNKVHTGVRDPDTNLRWDWNSLLDDGGVPRFTTYSAEYFPPADRLVDYLEDFAAHHRLNIRTGVRVTRIARAEDGGFVLEDAASCRLRARRLIVATGRARLRMPTFPGVELAEPYTTMSIDPADFLDQRVLIIGKGNSAFETADNLNATTATIHMLSPSAVRLAWQTHYVGDLRAVNNNLLDTYQLKSQNTIIDATVERIVRLADRRLRVDFAYTHAEGERRSVEVERVLLCTGFQFDDEMFDASCRVDKSPCGRFPRMTPTWESTSVSGLFFAGALMHGRDYRKSFSGFIHGFRYNIEFLARYLAWRDRGEPLALAELPRAQVAERILDRVNRASSLFQQPGFLGDAIALGELAQHLRDAPVDLIDELIADPRLFGARRHLVVTMEYGKVAPGVDPFNIHRFPNDGSRSAFIHPVIRCREHGVTVAEHHVPEDLENHWRGPVYAEPLAAFLRSVGA